LNQEELNFFFASELYHVLDPRGTSFIPKPIHASKQAKLGPNKCYVEGKKTTFAGRI
jgi:hypothetical protein